MSQPVRAALLAGAVVAALPGMAAAALPQQSGGPVDLANFTGQRLDGAKADDRAGTSAAAAGDVNGDGVGDVIVGAPLADPGSRQNAGSAFVVFGHPVFERVDLGGAGVAGFRIDGAVGGAVGDRLGTSVAGAGDVNGDGIDDVIVGAYNADNARGRAYVVFGSRTPADVDTAALGARGLQIDGQPPDGLGTHLGLEVDGAGDVNGDGTDDVIVGAYRADNNGRNQSGSAFVIFGGPSTETVDTNALGSRGFRVDGPIATANGAAGRSVAGVGDMNGDGLDDVIVGVPFTTNGGRADVVFGKATTTAIDLAAPPAGYGFRINGINADFSGVSVAGPGDVNGDGVPDVVVSAHLADNNGRTDSGSAYVVFGRSTTTTVGLGSLGAGGFRIDGQTASDLSGLPLAGAGDLNDDGLADVAVATARADHNGRTDSGSVYVVFGRTATSDVDLAALGTAGFVVDGAAADDDAGYDVSGGTDLTGDGRPDLLVGAQGADAPSRGDAGAAFVVPGFGAPALSYPLLSGTAGQPVAPVTPTLRRTGTASFGAAGLAAGLALDPATGVVTGTPSQPAAGSLGTITMTDLAGSVSAPLTGTVAAAPVTPAAPATPPPAALSLTALRTACVRPRGVRRAVLCRVRVRFRLSRSAAVRVTVWRTGVRRALGTVRVAGRTGANSVLLPRRVGRRLLTPGRYTVSLRASSGPSLSAARSAKVRVRVLPRRR